MSSPKLPSFNINLEDIISKVEEMVAPIVESISEAFEAPEAEVGAVSYDDHYADLIYALQAKIEAIEKSEALPIDQKIVAQTELYKIWAHVIS